ncbi:MAG: hypothetical protein H6631_19015 [Anaerolineaceae bacterium]|nr:hypothetical protein [Anaerolineaceae bacterium]
MAIAFSFRKYFKGEKLKELKAKLKKLEVKRDAGNLTEKAFEAAKEDLLSNYFK